MVTSGGEADWQWDDTLFAGAAPYYARGRLPYAPGLADALAEILELDVGEQGSAEPGRRSRLLDVGCGPGTIALSLVHLFGEVVGVDPDAGMIAEAERTAVELGVAERARWVRARAEDLPCGLGMFDVAVFAQSFHWMDRDRVAATVKGMLRPGGALVHVSDLKTETSDLKTETSDLKTETSDLKTETSDLKTETSDLKTETQSTDGLPYPAPPLAAVDALVRHYLGPVRRAGQGVLPQGTPGGEAAVFARAGFEGPWRHVVPGGHLLERTADDVVAGVFSLSSSAPHLFGDRRDRFEADLRGLLREASAADHFSERTPSTEVFVWRNERNAGR